jgi:2-C-methyl-D-erythritol 4-phosphate cytidylyltransferase
MMSTASRHWAVVPAAGVGQRMAADRPKQYLPLCGRTVIEHSLERLLSHPAIEGIVVAVGVDDPYWADVRVESTKPVIRARGGRERCESVLNALRLLTDRIGPEDWAVVHDAARPCLAAEDLDRLLTALADDPLGGILATPVRDTMKREDGGGRVARTEERAGLWHALTPQMFRLGALVAALEQAEADGYVVTDEASAIEHVGGQPRLIEGRADNLKITRPEDLALAEFYLSRARAVHADP